MKEAIEKSKQSEVQISDSAAFNLCKLMNYLVYIALFAISLFCLNVGTNGDFGRMVSSRIDLLCSCYALFTHWLLTIVGRWDVSGRV